MLTRQHLGKMILQGGGGGHLFVSEDFSSYSLTHMRLASHFWDISNTITITIVYCLISI